MISGRSSSLVRTLVGGLQAGWDQVSESAMEGLKVESDVKKIE